MIFPNRRDFLKAAGPTAASFLLRQNSPAASPKRDFPNIVFILADDMGYGDLACQNPESKIPTPNLDKLAGESMLFTDAHSPSAVCTPTRYSILTGRYCWRTELKRGVLWPWDKPLIESDRLTAARLLKDSGYHTACIGKWHLGWNWATTDGTRINDTLTSGIYNEEKRTAFGNKIDYSERIGGGPLTKGFDYYFGDDVPNFPPYCFIENDKTLGIPDEMKPLSMFGHPGMMVKSWKLDTVMPAITEKAVDYIEKRAKYSFGQPFFLYFTLTAPHTPIAPASEFHGSSHAGAYGDYVVQVDHTAGEILRAIERSGNTGNTLVIFSSDNGSPGRDGTDMNGEINSVRKYGHNPSRPWRGIKADAWDGGHRVPFIVRWPGRIPAGSVCDELVCQVDFLATVAAILGQKLPDTAGEDSCSILPLLEGEKPEAPLREAVIHHSGDGLFCVRQGKWKLILGLGAGGFSGGIRKAEPGEPKGQLYDMYADPEERNNVYEIHPEVVHKLGYLLEKYRKSGRSTP